MGVRIVDERHCNVIPLCPQNGSGQATQTKPVAEPSSAAAPLPEPTQLYGLVALAFLLHIPTRRARRCVRCATAWPCDHLRLAFRLREGF